MPELGKTPRWRGDAKDYVLGIPIQPLIYGPRRGYASMQKKEPSVIYAIRIKYVINWPLPQKAVYMWYQTLPDTAYHGQFFYEMRMFAVVTTTSTTTHYREA